MFFNGQQVENVLEPMEKFEKQTGCQTDKSLFWLNFGPPTTGTSHYLPVI